MVKTYFQYFYFVILLFFLKTPFAFALEIKDYVPVPGIGTPEDCAPEECLGQYVAYWSGLAIMAAGILAVICLAIGGVRLITSAGGPRSQKDAIDAIKGAVLGLILLVSAFIILTTINPELVKPSLTPLTPGEGVFYTNGSDRLPAPMSEPNTYNIPKGYNQLIYVCRSGPSLFVRNFPETNFKGIEGAFTSALECGGSINIKKAKSFKLEFETAGLYYCMGECGESGIICSGFMSSVNATSGPLPEPFRGNTKLKSVLFVNDLYSGIHYGAIFHDVENPADAGSCSEPFNTIESLYKKRFCVNIESIPKSSVTVFAWNYENPETSGTGINFYSEPWGEATGARAGKYFLSNNDIATYAVLSAKELDFNYTGIARPEEHKKLYKSFYDSPGSIYLSGNYLVELREGSAETAGCQVFFNNVFNVKETEFINTKKNIGQVVVIPVK